MVFWSGLLVLPVLNILFQQTIIFGVKEGEFQLFVFGSFLPHIKKGKKEVKSQSEKTCLFDNYWANNWTNGIHDSHGICIHI